MKTTRAALLMFAGLACGIGVRLAFSLPADPGKSRAVRRAAANASKDSDHSSSPAPASGRTRPPESAILTATGGPRLRLLLAWLPEAQEEELLRMADVLHQPEGEEGPALALLMARWAEVNPRAMLKWARSNKEDETILVNDALTAWARIDFESALATAAKDTPGRQAAVLRGLVWRDPGKCLRLLAGHTDLFAAHTASPANEVFHRLMKHHPAGLAALIDSANGSDRAGLAADVALAWARTDPAAAVAWITKPGSSVPPERWEETGVWLASHAPEHLSALWPLLSAGPVRTSIENAALAHLAATDPDAARRQLDAMPASPARQYRRALLLTALLSRGDEAGALALASQLGWALQYEWHPDWYETVATSGDFRLPHFLAPSDDFLSARKAMEELMDRVAARDPKQAAAIFANNEDANATMLLSGKPETRPAALADALLEADDKRSRECFETLKRYWSADNPAAVATWALQRGGADGDAVVIEVLENWSEDVDAALAWAAKLTPAQRLPLLQRVMPAWQAAEFVNVAGALEASALPADEKQQLREVLSPP